MFHPVTCFDLSLVLYNHIRPFIYSVIHIRSNWIPGYLDTRITGTQSYIVFKFKSTSYAYSYTKVDQRYKKQRNHIMGIH